MLLQLKKLIRSKVGGNNFISSVMILISGTMMAQAISFAVLPLISRLYTPEDFSVFAVYNSIVSIILVAACLRFEIAIPIPENDEEGFVLFFLAVASNILILISTLLLTFFFGEQLTDFLNQKKLLKYIWYIPFGVFLAGLYNALQYWATRKKNFKEIAATRINQSLSGAAVQLGAGALGYAPAGLIVGQIFNYSAGITRLMRSLIQYAKNFKEILTLNEIRRVCKKYDKFPKYSTFDALANTASIQMPIIAIGAISDFHGAGYLIIIMKIMAVPIALLGNAVSQVYLSHSAKEISNGNIAQFTQDTLIKLFKYGVSFILILVGFLYCFSDIIFGKKWIGINVFFVWLAPWFIFQLISSPISMIMHVKGQQKLLLGVTLFGFALKMLALYWAYTVGENYLIPVFGISSALFYLICYVIFSNVAEVKFFQHIFILKKSFPYLMLGLSIGLVFVGIRSFL